MLDPKHPLAELLRRDSRYRAEAYIFVFDALRYGQENMGLGAPPEESTEPNDDEAQRHVTGQELCYAIQSYAIDQYGLMARSVLEHWGVGATSDFGEIVFNLIEIGPMRKTEHDRREDFDNVFEFEEAFGEQAVFSADHCRADGDTEE